MHAESIKSIIRRVKRYDDVEIGPETRLTGDLRFDSMDVMDLVLTLEQQFDFTFRDEDLDLEQLDVFGHLLTTVSSYVDAK